MNIFVALFFLLTYSVFGWVAIVPYDLRGLNGSHTLEVIMRICFGAMSVLSIVGLFCCLVRIQSRHKFVT